MGCMITAPQARQRAQLPSRYALCTWKHRRNLCRSKLLTFLPVAALAAVMAVPVAALIAQLGQRAGPARIRFESMDTNRDGAISRAEWRGAPRSFDVHDWNGDGRLSGQEVAIGAQRNTNWEDADHLPNRFERYVSWTQAGFNNLDHNRDRRITANEWHFDVETFRRVDRNRDGALDQAGVSGRGRDDLRGDNFDDLDGNNNGRVERAEWYGGADVFTSSIGIAMACSAASRWSAARTRRATRGISSPILDYDRNGSLARDEWHWSDGSASIGAMRIATACFRAASSRRPVAPPTRSATAGAHQQRTVA